MNKPKVKIEYFDTKCLCGKIYKQKFERCLGIYTSLDLGYCSIECRKKYHKNNVVKIE